MTSQPPELITTPTIPPYTTHMAGAEGGGDPKAAEAQTIRIRLTQGLYDGLNRDDVEFEDVLAHHRGIEDIWKAIDASAQSSKIFKKHIELMPPRVRGKKLSMFLAARVLEATVYPLIKKTQEKILQTQ